VYFHRGKLQKPQWESRWFTSQHTALRAAYPAWSTAQNGLNMARAERNARRAAHPAPPPEASASYKLCSLTAEGNARGSNPITRPAPLIPPPTCVYQPRPHSGLPPPTPRHPDIHTTS
jgi:hypothetical protein